MQKFQATAAKVGTQATAFGQKVATEAQVQGTKTLTGFKLENEVRPCPHLGPPHAQPLTADCALVRRGSQCTKSAKILQSFLADPNHPESALNAIPKQVLARAKGSVVQRGDGFAGLWRSST